MSDPVAHNNKNNEETIIEAILDNINYPQNTIQQKQKQKPPKKNSEQKRKWAIFTFFGPETRTITKLFRNTEFGIAYRTKSNIKHLLRTKQDNNGKYNLSGVYQLQSADCPQKYVGQTGQMFKTRFKEHISDVKNNGQNSLPNIYKIPNMNTRQ
jgi:hypothetical protein